MRKASMLRKTMLFVKSSMLTNMSNRCSMIALAFLYPSCSWRNCYSGRKCHVGLVEIWFCIDWQGAVTLLFLLWLPNTTLNFMTLFVLVVHVIRTVLILFLWIISLICVIQSFVSFVVLCVFCHVFCCSCCIRK